MVNNTFKNNIVNVDEFSLCFPSIAAYLDKDNIRILLRHLTVEKIVRDDVLIQYGELTNTLFMLFSGELHATIHKNKKVVKLGTIYRGKWVGEVSLIDPGPATATVSVTENGSILRLSHSNFELLNKMHPAISIAILRAISIDLANRMRKSVDSLLHGIADEQGNTMDTMTKATQNLVGIENSE